MRGPVCFEEVQVELTSLFVVVQTAGSANGGLGLVCPFALGAWHHGLRTAGASRMLSEVWVHQLTFRLAEVGGEGGTTRTRCLFSWNLESRSPDSKTSYTPDLNCVLFTFQ